MLDVARILGGMALVSLILAMAAAISPAGRIQLRRLNGAAAAEGRRLETAAMLLMMAVGLSSVAAVLAITSWFST